MHHICMQFILFCFVLSMCMCRERKSISRYRSCSFDQLIVSKLRYFFHFANSYKPSEGPRGAYPYYFCPRTICIKTPLILYNADKRNAKHTLISEFADKTARAVSANYWRKSPKTHPNCMDVQRMDIQRLPSFEVMIVTATWICAS